MRHLLRFHRRVLLLHRIDAFFIVYGAKIACHVVVEVEVSGARLVEFDDIGALIQ